MKQLRFFFLCAFPALIITAYSMAVLTSCSSNEPAPNERIASPSITRSTTGRPGAERLRAAEAALKQKVADESKGAITLHNFNKRNGIEKSQSEYTLEWRATIKIEQDGWKNGDIFTGYWQDFYLVTDERHVQHWAHPKQYSKGKQVDIKGECDMRLTDNGWRVETIRMQ